MPRSLCFHSRPQGQVNPRHSRYGNRSRIRPPMDQDSQSFPSNTPADRVESASTMLVSSLAGPGQIVSDRFRIEKLIARGGMGEVYRATDLELNRIVALKTVRSSALMAQELRTRLRQEAQLISKLNHSGICTLYDVRQHAGIDY